MKKISWIISGVLLIGFLYYLFIKPSDFEINLNAKTLPGDLIETIRIWNRSLDSAQITEVDSFSSLRQAITWKNRNYIFDWSFSSVNDSLTKVNIKITEPARSVLNRLLIPFTNQNVELDAAELANTFYAVLKSHLEITKVKIIGVTEIDSLFCVCRTLNTPQIEKANGMMKDYPLLSEFVSDFGLAPDGPPLVRVIEWSHNQGLLKFDFCFPIVERDSLPKIKEITYKWFKKQRALKAEYYGNYITSDRAWYELIQFAEKNGYLINRLPIERFHNNPNLGIKETEWKADVYLPIKE